MTLVNESEPPTASLLRDVGSSGARVRLRFCRWSFCFLLWWIVGFAIGAALDHALWNVSFNYVFSPGEFTRQFSRWSLATSTIIAAISSTGRTPVRIVPAIRSAVVCLALTFTFAIAWGTIDAWNTPEKVTSSEKHLAPLRRVRFCHGMTYGAKLGFGVGTLSAVVLLALRSPDPRTA